MLQMLQMYTRSHLCKHLKKTKVVIISINKGTFHISKHPQCYMQPEQLGLLLCFNSCLCIIFSQNIPTPTTDLLITPSSITLL